MKWLALVAVAAGALRWDPPSGDGVRHGQALAFTPPSHACQPRMHSASSGAGSRWLASGRGRQAGALRGGARRNVGGSSRNGVCMMAEEIECDVVIVGGGPAGCTCALYTSRADLKTVIVDKNPSIGALAITSTIANYPGVDRSMSGEALLDQMREQAVQYGTDYRRAQVFLVDTEGDRKYVYTPDATFVARALVLATGAMGRKPSYTGEDTYLGQGVSYCATCDGAFYRDSEVAVVGVNQEAVEEAQFLTKFASTVHWITNTKITAEEGYKQQLLSCPNVKHWDNTRMTAILGDDSGVTGITVQEKGSSSEEQIDAEGVFIYVAGSKPITDFCEGKVAFKEDGGVDVNDEMSTNVPGVFAIGDIRNTPYKQVVVAASDGCVAAMAIDRYLKGRKSVKVDWIHE